MGTPCLLSDMEVPIRFCLHAKESFEALAESEGFTPLALYGDYTYGVFDLGKSPFMIWIPHRS
jgi:hypothetical protein